MSVQRYRDVSEMPAVAAGDPKDPVTYARVRELWRFSARHLPALFAPGLYRYRSVEESDRAREEASIARMRALRHARAQR
jgi:hypothetical protein